LPGALFTATATLDSGTSACFSDEPISFTFPGQPTEIGITNASGEASVTFRAPIGGGTFPIQAVFAGTPSCGASDDIGDLTVVASTAQLTVLNVPNVSAPGGTTFTVSAKLKPTSCGAGEGVIIVFPAQNVEVVTTTGSNAVATARFIAPIAPGTYPIQVTFEGSSVPSPGCLPTTDTAQLTVLPPGPTTMTVANVSARTGSFFTARATLGPQSCAFAQSVSFAFNGATKTSITNLSGVATASFIAPGIAELLPIQAFFGGTPTCAANSGTGTIAVQGTTAPPTLGISPTSLNFSSQPIGSSSSAQNIMLANDSNVALKVASVAISSSSKTSRSAFIEADSCVPVVARQSACSIRVSFTPSATGSQAAMLEIQAGSRMQKVPLSGTGIVAATVSPARLSFGSQRVATTSRSMQVRVTNNLATQLSFSNFFADGDFAIGSNGCANGVSAHASCNVAIQFKPAVTGARTGLLTIDDTASSVPLTVTLSGTGHR
jgi:hypothetical protein